MREACLIGGEWVTAERWMEVDDPATGAIIGRVPMMDAAATGRAIAAAQAAMGEWAARPAKARADILRRFFDLVRANRAALADLMVAEQGKPRAEALGEIDYAASFLEWFAEEARRAYGEIVPAHAADKRIMVLKQPVGVVAAITPWNFPAAMVTRKIAPAVAAGCGVVVKPAPQTPFTALALAALGEEAGLPPGLLNVVTGDAAEIGGVLTASPIVRKISFTGSTGVGALLYGQSAATIKKLSLELGGNAPFIVFDDADLDAAVEGAMASKFRNAGQTCVCANRIYVQGAVYDAFVERLTHAVEGLSVGAGTEEGVSIGPLIDAAAVAKVERHIADAMALGGRVLAGGERHARGGRFFQPTVIRDVTPAMLITREETFGPVAPVIRFDTEAEVVAMANATDFGLAAYFYARDMSRIWRVAEAIEAGIIGVNTGLISTEVAPFGGVKMSGLGREGSHHGLDDYLELKYVCLGLDAAPTGATA
ncbi:NAD-dependent succinate-semialdehyde dehydrogenase [Sphingomonas naphthae]|uniref:NAD-dependent succinate-semialdehyde dehydrogenase n=1 Tax=Sphingomonas naphthae TaxID=1813468 RepID=A0ABY7TT45_9SPHN|nr:NAD-dependent succinate-semialdehyde dehydrogenase [Sphingomonas naphthae]WCT75389.1 NAD-dependent succinate-semialdehyde dehydrogenase [Sphingomonas naphthae]